MPGQPSILLVKLSSIGDVVMTTAAARALRKDIPNAKIYWAVESKSAGVLEANPDIDRLFVWKRDSFRTFREFASELRAYEFDIAVDLQGMARSAMVTRVSGAKRRIGFAYGREFSKMAYNEIVECETKLAKGSRCCHSMNCYMRMMRYLGVKEQGIGDMRIAVTPEENAKVADLLSTIGIGPNEPFAGISPATTRDNKHWTKPHWAKLSDLLWENLGLKTVYLGSPGNREYIDDIISQSGAPCINAAGETSLKQAAVVLDRSKVVVAVDTGLLHVGTALGKPTVGIFGPTNAWENHAHRKNFVLSKIDMDCYPCRKNVTCEGRFDCMVNLMPEKVFDGVEKVMSRCTLQGVSK